MAVVIFSKQLSKTDVECRLAIPTGNLGVFGIPRGENSRVFEAIDSNRRPWSFRVSTRKQGRYAKPVVTKDWIAFVREKGLKKNDKITFSLEANNASNGFIFRIQEEKLPVVLFGKNLRAAPNNQLNRVTS